jgi:glucose/arabinose dehydrogenase
VRSARAILARWSIFACLGLLAALAQPAAAIDLPNGFQDSVVFEGLREPTNFRFAPDGRVFVAEKSGKIEVFDGLSDPTPTLFADLRTQVYDKNDRGLLGLAVDPQFPTRPYVYALYTYDHVLGEAGEAPKWGTPEHTGDDCPDTHGADDCLVSGRLVRLTASGDEATPSPAHPQQQVLLEDWCQQFSSHSIGDLQFGPDGALYVSGGDGASFYSVDVGDLGEPPDPCGDPPDEGGALRSQDVLTPADPTNLNGSVARIDPDTGEGEPGNPMFASADANARRIVAFGFRNPFRFAVSPTTNEIYVGNVGWFAHEEIDRFNPTSGTAYDSGWPCYEADEPQVNYQTLDLSLCETLYANPSLASPPFFSYEHYVPVTPGDTCPNADGSAVAGLAFYTEGSFPTSYDGALFFSDPVRDCLYVMLPGEDGRPDPSKAEPFLTGAGPYPAVDVEMGPDGNLYYASLYSEGFGLGGIHRIAYFSGNQPPIAKLTATPEWGDEKSGPGVKLETTFDATDSEDPDGDLIAYEWDLDGNGAFDDPTSDGTMTETYEDAVNHTVAVRVADPHGGSSIDRVTVYPGDTPPRPAIEKPDENLTWGVGQRIEFEGSAEDDEDGDLPSGNLDWDTRLLHCPASCHSHPLQAFPAVASGGFIAPNHEYPSHLELTLTARDTRGLEARRTVSIDPRSVDLEIASDPAGMTLGAGLTTATAPFDLTAIEEAKTVLFAPTTQELDGTTYRWSGWSDGGDRIHSVVADKPARYVASYAPLSSEEVPVSMPPPTETVPVAPSPPSVRLLRHPGKTTSQATATFAFSSSAAGASFRCKLDEAKFASCRSPRTYKNLQPGHHVFEVVARDHFSGLTSSASRFGWRVLCPKPAKKRAGAASSGATQPRPGCAKPAGSAGRAGR